jgi:hypothetical protein
MGTRSSDFNLDVKTWNPNKQKYEKIRARLDPCSDYRLLLRYDHVQAWALEHHLKPYHSDRITAANGTDFNVCGTLHLYWTCVKIGQLESDQWIVVEELPFDAIIGIHLWDQLKRLLPAHVLGPAQQFEQLGCEVNVSGDSIIDIVVSTEWLLNVVQGKWYKQVLDAQGMFSHS